MCVADVHRQINLRNLFRVRDPRQCYIGPRPGECAVFLFFYSPHLKAQTQFLGAVYQALYGISSILRVPPSSGRD